MNVEEIKELIKTKDYDFLRTNQNLGGNIILLTLGGSYAYGTNNENSDIDIRGCALNKLSELTGIKEDFEQVTEEKTDTVVYSLKKLTKLLLSCNPNTIEILGCKDEHYIYMTALGEKLISNKKLFLSKRAGITFGGYANAQLNRLYNNIARFDYSQAEKEEHILRSVKSAVLTFNERYSQFDENSMALYTDKAQTEELDREIYVDIELKRFPLREFKSISAEMTNIIRDYDKINHRNKKKSSDKLSKHMCHLIRLYMMGTDILENGEINTYREGKEHNLLVDIRNGKYYNEDEKSISKEFTDIMEHYAEKFERAVKISPLPEKPDIEKINSLIMEMNEEVSKK